TTQLLADIDHILPVTGHWSLVIGHWSLVIGHWSLVTGHRSPVTGHWSPVTSLGREACPRFSHPPPLSMRELRTNTGVIPNMEPRLPNISGTTMWVTWLIVTRTPSASPERPSGARLKMSMRVTGGAQPMLKAKTRET